MEHNSNSKFINQPEVTGDEEDNRANYTSDVSFN